MQPTQDILTFSGIYLYQSNAIFINHPIDALLRQREEAPTLLARGGLHGWREIEVLLTLRHEENHFVNFLASPLLSFMGDLNDIYMSQFSHMFRQWVADNQGTPTEPLAQASVEGRLCEPVKRQVDMLSRLKMLRHLLLFESGTISDAVERLNTALGMIAVSKGLSPTDVGRVTTNLPDSCPFHSDRLTTLHILEGLARLIESYSLQEFRVSPSGRADWTRRKIVGQYKPALEHVINVLGWDLGAVALNLCLRGQFFPFLQEQSLDFEEFHPPALLERIVRFMEGEASARSIGGQPSEAQVLDIIACAIERFDLNTEAESFARNQAALDRRFPQAFPEIYGSEHYQSYREEHCRFQDKRGSIYDEALSNPLCIFEKPVATADRYFAVDGVMGVDHDYVNALLHRSNMLTTAHDRKLFVCGLADKLLYNDPVGLEMSVRVIRAMTKSAGIELGQEPQAFLLRRIFGVEDVTF